MLAGMKRLAMIPTTVSGNGTLLMAGFTCTPGNASTPLSALNLICWFNAVAGLPNPSAIAWLSVSSTSGAESDDGSRPALNTRLLPAWLRGGSDTSEPGWGLVPAPGALVYVPLIAIWPQAAATCACPASVARVPALNEVEL